MTALPITGEHIARAKRLLEEKQPNLDIRCAYEALRQVLKIPLHPDDASLLISGHRKSPENSTQELWGVLHAMAPDVVLFARNGKIGILRRTSTTEKTATFLVTWLTQNPNSAGQVIPLLCWSKTEQHPYYCVTESQMLFLPHEKWNEIKAWLDMRLPTISPPIE